jgi:hypothetical protein
MSAPLFCVVAVRTCGTGTHGGIMGNVNNAGNLHYVCLRVCLFRNPVKL